MIHCVGQVNVMIWLEQLSAAWELSGRIAAVAEGGRFKF